MNYAHPFLTTLRRLGQKMGILRPMLRLYRAISRSQYEEKFDQYVMRHIHDGEIVWDVGANIGFFTEKFAAAVGPAGRVISFEPSPGTFAALTDTFADRANITLENVALSDFDGEADFRVSADPTDPTNGMAVPSDDTATTKVQVRCGRSYCTTNPERIPDRIKIDVEGFELEVLRGLGDFLAAPRLKSLFIEVHFLILAERGHQNGAAEIQGLLKQAGLTVRWIDPSHLAAERP